MFLRVSFYLKIQDEQMPKAIDEQTFNQKSLVLRDNMCI